MNQSLCEDPDSLKNRNYSKSSPLSRISSVVTSISGKKRRMKETETELLVEKVFSLEDTINSLRCNNEAGLGRYNKLAIENQNLRKLLDKMVKQEADARKEIENVRVRQLQKSGSEERALQERRHEQNILQSPLIRHMHSVECKGIHLFDDSSGVDAVIGLSSANQSKIFQSYHNTGQKEVETKGSSQLFLGSTQSTAQCDTGSSYLDLISCITKTER